MTSPYLSSPSPDLMAFFNFSENYPEPCSLTLEDAFRLSYEDNTRTTSVLTTNEPQRWAEVLFDPDDIVEFRMLPSQKSRDQMAPKNFLDTETAKRHKVFRWKKAKDINAIVNELTKMNLGAETIWREPGKEIVEYVVPLNIFASINPRRSIGGKTGKDVLLARNLFADLDNCTLEEANARIAKMNFPKPSMVVCSGYGIHLYWRLTEPITNRQLWTNLQKRMIVAFDSDKSIHDLPRVMRVPGFNNVKKDVPVSCFIHDADPGRKYLLNDLEVILPKIVAAQPKSLHGGWKKPAQDQISSPSSQNTSKKIKRAIAYASTFGAVEVNRNTTAFKLSCKLAEKFGLSQEELLTVNRLVNSKVENPLELKESGTIVNNAFVNVQDKGLEVGTALICPVIKFEESTTEVVPLEDWRSQMKSSRFESLGQVGKIFFDGSMTGAGKSTADLAAMKRAGKSATFVPTHDACEELVSEMRKEGLSAAQHPRLDSSTCLVFGTEKNPGKAQLALKAGLNVGRCICTTCPLADRCDYQKKRQLAKDASHVVATHARGALSDFHPAKDKPVVFFHEDIANLLRPMAKVVKTGKKDDAQELHLKELLQIAIKAEDIARSWKDDAAINFAKRLQASVEELIDALNSQELLKPFEDAVVNGQSFKTLPSLKVLKTNSPCERYEKIDHLLQRSMDRLGVFSSGKAVQLALGYCLGEIATLCLVVDHHHGKNGKNVFVQGLVGVWHNELPKESVVWIENASTNSESIQALIGRDVVDKTPAGKLEYKFPPLQYADVDVTKGTTPKIVRGIVRGLLAKFNNAQKVGIITQQCHVEALDELDPFWRSRISRIEYFRSGKDRASNSWLESCDLILVVGTPRVPPVAVRDDLIRFGNTNEATTSGDFGSINWEGRTCDGKLVEIEGTGYLNESWAESHRNLVKEVLLQAVGRGRGVCDRGVPVVVVSNESIGIDLANEPLHQIGESVDGTLRVVLDLLQKRPLRSSGKLRGSSKGELTDKSPIIDTIGEMSVNYFVTSDVTVNCQVSEKSVLRHLASLSSLGLLRRRGGRSGWELTDWVEALFANQPELR